MSRIHLLFGLPLGALAAVGLAACSVPDTRFQATPDATPGGGDDASTVVAIDVSTGTLDVTEGSTADFHVKLTRAPSEELVVRVAPANADAATKIGLSIPELRFQPTNFDQAQTITVTGLVDIDVVDAVAGIALTATGVDPVMLNAAVHDPDKVEIVTDIAQNGVLTINETGTANVRVHLSHQPSADVRVRVTLGSGPVTAAPSEHTFTPASYDVDQTFTFTAPDDVNVTSEDQSLTFQATGSADKPYTIHDVDKDTLNINATPTTLTVDEGGSAQVSVTLTKQPAANTTVRVELQSGNVAIDRIDLTFSPQNYDQAQAITVSAAEDANTANETNQLTLSIPAMPGVGNVTIGVKTADNDTQAILAEAPDPLSVTEGQTATFGVTLKFQPSTNVTVAVSSNSGAVATASPGTLTFTPQNYNDARVHQVTVRGSDDNNLATNSTSIKLTEATLVDKLVPVSVADDDHQIIQVSATMLSIPEGMSKTFDVSLKFDPGTTVRVDLANDNQSALPIDKTQITFTTANYATPVHVTVTPRVDNNNGNETGTVTLTGAAAPDPATVILAVSDTTVVQDWGYKTTGPGQFEIPAEFVYAYQINVGAVGNLNVFHTFLKGAGGVYSMALYTDNGGVPGDLVSNGAMVTPKVAALGVNDSDPLAMPPQLTGSVYWIAIRFSQMNTIGYVSPDGMGFPGVMGKRCKRNGNLALNLAWPGSFNSSTCTNDFVFNMWITTFHQ